MDKILPKTIESSRAAAATRSRVGTIASRIGSILWILGLVAGPCLRAHAQAPGPEFFAKEPETQLELWDAIDYLVRTDQAKKAVPYIEKLIKSKPNDATWFAIRNRYGPLTAVRLFDDASTRKYAQPFTDAIIQAARKYAVEPERMVGFVTALTKSRPEQDYAVRRLREAGPYAVPVLATALFSPGPAGC